MTGLTASGTFLRKEEWPMVFIELRRRATAGEGVKELKEVSAVTLTGVQRTLLEGGGIILVGGCAW